MGVVMGLVNGFANTTLELYTCIIMFFKINFIPQELYTLNTIPQKLTFLDPLHVAGPEILESVNCWFNCSTCDR